MAPKLSVLRSEAKKMGIAPGIIRGCDTAEELQSVIAGFGSSSNGESTKPRKKSAVKKKTHVKTKNSSSASSKSAPATKKSVKAGKAKRPTTAKGTDGPSGRNLLNGVDFSHTDGWNAREGSAPDRIIRALRKARGNRGKVFDALIGDVWDFVGKKKADGSKRSKADAEAMLRYRISRTAFDFAVRTGQHEPSDNRVEYGTGGTGQGTFKPARKGNSKTKAASAKKSSLASGLASAKASRKVSRKGKGSKSKSKK